MSLPLDLLDGFASVLFVSDLAAGAALSFFELLVDPLAPLAPSPDVDGFESPLDSLFDSLLDSLGADSGPDVRCAFFP